MIEQALECIYRLMEHPDALATALVRQVTAQAFGLSPHDKDDTSSLNISTLGDGAAYVAQTTRLARARWAPTLWTADGGLDGARGTAAQRDDGGR